MLNDEAYLLHELGNSLLSLLVIEGLLGYVVVVCRLLLSLLNLRFLPLFLLGFFFLLLSLLLVLGLVLLLPRGLLARLLGGGVLAGLFLLLFFLLLINLEDRLRFGDALVFILLP